MAKKEARLPARQEAQLAATQEIISIADIRDNIVIMDNAEMKVVLKVSGVNFDLYDTRDKQQLIFAFQTFLNSLEFPLQILIQSRPVNLDPYLQKLQKLSLKQPTEALKLETYEYITFIQQLARLGTIMDKAFYVVINYSAEPITTQGLWQKLVSSFSSKPQKDIIIRNFEESKRKIFERVQVVASGLSGLGLEAIQLTDPELVELFFTCFNPGAQVKNGEVLQQLENLWTTTPPATSVTLRAGPPQASNPNSPG